MQIQKQYTGHVPYISEGILSRGMFFLYIIFSIVVGMSSWPAWCVMVSGTYRRDNMIAVPILRSNEYEIQEENVNIVRSTMQ